jgi:spore coat protein H
MALPVRTLKLGDAAEKELESNLWTDRYTAASMMAGGKTESVKLRYRGGHTREYPKRSYDVVRGGQTYHYNAEYDDPSMIRNALSFAFFEWLGVPVPRCRHVQLFRNRSPLGVYLEIEGVGRRFFRKRGIGASSLFYAVNNMADFGLYHPETYRPKSSLLTGYEYRFGGAEEKKSFDLFLRGIHMPGSTQQEKFLETNLDTDNYLRWLAGAVLTGNNDGFEQNYAIYRHLRSGKYRMIPWDYEGTWGRNCYGQLQDNEQVPVEGYNQLTQKLLRYRTYRLRYLDILRQALKRVFTEKKVMLAAEKMTAAIATPIREDEMRRWSYREFQAEPEIIRRYIRDRRMIVARELDRMQ